MRTPPTSRPRTSGATCRNVRFVPVPRHRQHPVLQRQPPEAALNVTTATPHQRDQPLNYGQVQ